MPIMETCDKCGGETSDYCCVTCMSLRIRELENVIKRLEDGLKPYAEVANWSTPTGDHGMGTAGHLFNEKAAVPGWMFAKRRLREVKEVLDGKAGVSACR